MTTTQGAFVAHQLLALSFASVLTWTVWGSNPGLL